MFQALRDELVADPVLAGQPQEAADWLRRMLDYNVPLGKLNRGLAVLDAYRALSEGRELGEDDVFRAHALGWCIEFLQARARRRFGARRRRRTCAHGAACSPPPP